MEKRTTCINGKFVLAHRAAIAVADRGFRFGDGVFETIRIDQFVPYQWDLHMARLASGLMALRIPAPDVDFAAMARKMIARNEAREGFLRIAVSRGTGSRGYMPYPDRMPASWVMEYLSPMPEPKKPYTLWLSSIARIPLQCLPMQQKLAHGINNTLALLDARDHACSDALQLTTTGLLAETASANLFWIKDNTLFTPALDVGCLDGTTRDAILRLSPVASRTAHAGVAELQSAEAVFASNSRVGIRPVTSLAPMQWAFNTQHPVLAKLQALLVRDRTNYSAQHRDLWVTS